MAITQIPNRVATYGTVFSAPGDVDTLMGNDNDLNTRQLAVEHVTVNAKTGSYTLVLSDDGKCIEVTSATTSTITVPPNSSVAFPIGTVILVATFGAGTTTIAAGAGVTINAYAGLVSLAGQYAGASLRKRASDTWHLTGALA